MYKCRYCGEVFEEDEIRESVTSHPWRDGEADEVFEECPHCGGGDFEEAEQCNECGEWFLPEEMHGEYCTGCLRKKMDVKTVFAYAKENRDQKYFFENILSNDEIEQALLELANKKYQQAKDQPLLSSSKAFIENLTEYAEDDIDCFGEFIAGREEDKK